VAKKGESKKIIKPTLEIHPLANNRTWMEALQDSAFMMFPERDDWRKRFIYTMLEWASREDSLEITDFAIEMKMHRSMLYRWIGKWQDIKESFEIAKLMIASRRKKGALTRKFDKDVVFKDLHKYDSEWLEVNKYHSDMKKEEEKQSHTFIINDSKPRIVTREEMNKLAEDL
jgi:hypothetical protein